MLENAEGWMFICKLCGKNHQVPEDIASYLIGPRTLAGIPTQAIELGCSEKPGKELYSMTDFTPFRVKP